MCGIAGILGPAWEGSGIEQLTRAMARRGPDDESIWREPGIALGHRRLSIIGLGERGRNPMFNEDETLVLIFNGEIFNYKSLRQQLEHQGHTFRSETDTEVILHLYEEHGAALCRHLEGMYAFALWDRRKRQLFAARDPFGEKPFYYWHPGGTGQTFAFGSSVTALLRAEIAAPIIDTSALREYLIFGAFMPPATPIEGLRVLPAGHSLTFSAADGCLTLRQHHNIHDLAHTNGTHPTTLSWQDIRQAVERRMIADVPVGVFLSGGIDSTSVATAMRDVVGGRLISFSIGYESAYGKFDETSAAERTAARLDTEHYSDHVTASDFARSLDDLTAATDMPSHDGVNTYFASRLASRHVKVAMTGIGADELLGGYSTFRYAQKSLAYAHAPLARTALGAAGHLLAPAIHISEDRGRTSWPLLLLEQFATAPDDPVFRWFQVRRFLSPSQGERLLGSRLRAEPNESLWSTVRHRLDALTDFSNPSLDPLRTLECGAYLTTVLLRDADAMSMYNGLELRVPFLDSHFVRQSLSQPADQLVSDREGKLPLRAAVANHLPPETLGRAKKGFGVPLGAWLRSTPIRDDVKSRLLAPSMTARELFDRKELHRLVGQFLTSSSPSAYRLTARVWMIYGLLRWLDFVGAK